MGKWVETDNLDINPNEYVYALSELNLHPEGGSGWRRMQVIVVPRGEKFVRCSRDLGPAEGFVADEFRIPGGIFTDDGRFEGIHTVGELVEEAAVYRQKLTDRVALEEPRQAAPLDQMYYEAEDDNRQRNRANPRTGDPRRWHARAG